jgi:hypothetical protein
VQFDGDVVEPVSQLDHKAAFIPAFPSRFDRSDRRRRVAVMRSAEAVALRRQQPSGVTSPKQTLGNGPKYRLDHVVG